MSDAADLLHDIIAALAPPTAGTRTKARAQQRAQDLLATALREAHEAGRREGIERAERLLEKEADEWCEAERHFEDHGEGAEALHRWWAGKGVREALDTLRALAQEGEGREG